MSNILLLRRRKPRPTAQYRLNEGSGQTLHDATGHGYDGTLGSTAGSDTNDPAWTGGGLSFATDDFCKFPLSIDPNSDFSVYIAANVGASAPAAEQTYLSAASSSNLSAQIVLSRVTSGNLQGRAYNNSWASGTFADMAAGVVASGIRLLKLKRAGNALVLKDVSSGVTATGNFPAPPTTINQMTLGCRMRQTTADYYLSQSIYWHETYQYATSDAEDRAIYRNIKAKLAQRGVTIA